METYLAETFTKDWILYTNKCNSITHKYEYMLCDALLDRNSNFANMLLDLDLIKDFGYFFSNTLILHMTALMIAAHRGDLTMIKKLKDKGANINAYNCDGTTALTFAISCTKCESVKILIELGADINFQVDGSDTPLMIAAHYRLITMFTMLLEFGADINIKNKKLLTVTDILNNYLSQYIATSQHLIPDIKTMIDILNKKKENAGNITSMNKPKNKCNYGTNCLNFKNGACSLDHTVNCMYGKDCINYKQGICLLEH